MGKTRRCCPEGISFAIKVRNHLFESGEVKRQIISPSNIYYVSWPNFAFSVKEMDRR
jgi:hypothetical protein